MIQKASSQLALTLLAVIGTVVAPKPAEAKVFRNAYVSFELPERWDCALEHTEWVCRINAPQVDNREAVIILTAKEVGPADSLGHYETHLKTARTIPNRMGQMMSSQIIKVEQRNIANHPWIDGMHLSSEVPNYYTRYLATTKDKIGVLVTFSAHKLHFTKYSADFFRAIESLRVIALRATTGRGGTNLPGGDVFGGAQDVDMMNGMSDFPEEGSGEGGSSGMATNLLAFALIIGAVGAYLMMKRKKK